MVAGDVGRCESLVAAYEVLATKAAMVPCNAVLFHAVSQLRICGLYLIRAGFALSHGCPSMQMV